MDEGYVSRNKIALFSLIVSFVVAVVQIQSCSTAKEAIDKSSEANMIALGVYDLDKGMQSHTLVTRAFDDLYDGGTREAVMWKLSEGKSIDQIRNLGKVMNVFEWIGDAFCEGWVYRRHVRSQLAVSLGWVCNNDQVYQNYNGSFNGVAMLCAEFSVDSRFAHTLDSTNLHNCKFLDYDNVMAQ
jgi:hypothetical protein